ncbi:hypothetical protein SAMN05660473_00243 [Arthrobacter sp. 49Tsu3.1M3]|uniref:ferredoxin n=1 Tax=Arthrobacter sp. 49Tsu3.1M3 TaxID=1279029 RepID=UPI0009CC0BEF|nr:hypothetical protein [Arthrobacter sp. 49Tsu3.1M3]SKB34584.1 hypothetical protein SAMN05660473_00243 [Arthrobacter sp. 49Tsu3.1M3]
MSGQRQGAACWLRPGVVSYRTASARLDVRRLALRRLMHLDDDGELVLDVPDVEGADLDAAKAAVRVCPVAALRLAAA